MTARRHCTTWRAGACAAGNIFLVLTPLCPAASSVGPGGGSHGGDAPLIDAGFTGGNIVVENCAEGVVRVHQDLRDTRTNWFYWAFRVRNAGGRTLEFRFTRGRAIGARGPAVSTDGGLSWAWLGADGWGPDWFRHRFDPAAGETRFCVAIPYLEADLDRFLTRHRGNGALRREVLCASRHGREVELLRVPRADGAPGPRVVLTARHHACESLANWVLEGIIDAWLSTEDPGVSLHRRAELVAIPFVDKDGVEEGDQGKNRAPHDHNRDYSGAGLYPETRAIRDRLAAWLPQGVLLALDIHCPNLAGQSSERIFFVGAPVASSWAEIARLAGILERTRQGPLAYRVADNLPHGKGWNVAANYRDGASFGRYVTQLPGHPPAGSIEVPYADALGVEVNAANARALGADIARAIRLWLR